MVDEEATLLIPKDKNKLKTAKSDDRSLTRVFGAFQTTKARKHLLFSFLGFATVITTVLLLLLTPMGCVLSSAFSCSFEIIEYFITHDLFRYEYLRFPVFDATESNISTLNLTDNTLRIVLLGDSLINKPYEMHDLAGKIRKYLIQYPYTLEITNCGFNGATISSIMDSPLNNCALPLKPHAVILFWDSDCSNVQEFDMTEADVTTLRITYMENVATTVNTLVETGAFVALTGTGVLGEGKKLFAPYWESRFQHKEPMLDAYNEMNELVATEYHIPFINVRAAFLAYVPFYQLCYSKCVTFDGEHENLRGTVIVAKLFSDTLSGWLTS